MKNLKAINITESNYEKEYKEIYNKYNIGIDLKVTEFIDKEEKIEETTDIVVALEHKGRSYLLEHIGIYNHNEDPRAPYNSYYNEYYQLYINGKKASGANNWDWLEYNLSTDYQIVPKIVQKELLKNMDKQERQVIEYYRNQD